MPKCPKCNQEYDIDHYKKRKTCSVCGFKISVLQDESFINKKDSSDNTGKVRQIHMESLKSIATTKKKETPVQIKIEKHSQTKNETSVSNNAYSKCVDDPIFSSHLKNIDNTNIENDTEETTTEINYLNDPIFLNTEGPLDISEEPSDFNIEISDANSDNIDADADEENEYVSHISPIDNDKESNIHLPLKLEHIPIVNLIVKYITYKRHKNDEQLETSEITFHFNKDGFYNDTEPDVPPEVDIIPPKTIAKVIGAILLIFFFIAFIIYYA